MEKTDVAPREAEVLMVEQEVVRQMRTLAEAVGREAHCPRARCSIGSTDRCFAALVPPPGCVCRTPSQG